MHTKQDNFEFTLIVPVYNVEKYLDQCMKSILSQSIGFKKNIQVILVNDNSIDNSGKICEKYRKKFPENIKYIKKDKNEGLAAARNTGIKEANGKIINFIDSDDYFPTNTLEKVQTFFKENRVDYVTIPLMMFEARNMLHKLYKTLESHGTGIVNLEKHPDCFFLSSAATFYKKELFQKYKFDENLRSSEDAGLNSLLFIEKPQFGYIHSSETRYYYRKRFSQNSLIDEYSTQSSYHTNLFHIFDNLQTYLNQRKQPIPLYIQKILIYEIGHRIKQYIKPTKKATEKRILTKYKEILSSIEPKVFLEAPIHHNSIELKLAFIRLREGLKGNVNKVLKLDGVHLTYKDIKFKRIDRFKFVITDIFRKKKWIIIKGEVIGVFIHTPHFQIIHPKGQTKKSKIKAIRQTKSDNINSVAGFQPMHIYTVRIKIPLNTGLYTLQYTQEEYTYNLVHTTRLNKFKISDSTEYIVTVQKEGIVIQEA